MTKDEALRLALEALGEFERAGLATLKTIDAIIAIKQALEEKPCVSPEPEPVAWVDLLKEAQKIVESKPVWKRFIDGTPLANDIACWMADFAQQHTSPPKREWQRLTDQDRNAIRGKYWIAMSDDVFDDIEAKLKEKNT